MINAFNGLQIQWLNRSGLQIPTNGGDAFVMRVCEHSRPAKKSDFKADHSKSPDYKSGLA